MENTSKLIAFTDAASIEAMTIAKQIYLPAMTDFDEVWKLVPEKSLTVKGQNDRKDADKTEKLTYELIYEKVIRKEYSLRGDCINIVSVTNDEYRRLFKTDTLPVQACYLMDLCRTPGNFFLIPYKNAYSVTDARKSGPTKGYFDRFLLAVYNFFFGITDYSGSLNSVLKDDDLAEFYKSYLREKYTSDDNLSWIKFVEINFLQDYVEGFAENSYGKPIEFWPGHFTGKAMPETEGEFILFYENAADLIRKRGDRINLRLQGKRKKY